MNLVNYYDLNSLERGALIKFLKDCSKETDQPAHSNMYDIDWENKNNTLLYILEKTNRFKIDGMFTVLFDNNIVIAVSGIYKSNFCTGLAIAGTRTWINKSYRNKQIPREILLPHEKSWAIQNKYSAVGLCFNDYNKNIIKTFYRKRLGENRIQRSEHHLFYNGINQVEFPVIVQNTKQWIIYEKLNESFSFDWNTIKCK